MRVFFTNLGCKLNQAELERLARQFAAAGHRVVGELAAADLHVVNTCTVTQQAARTSRRTARRGARLRPGLRTVLTGCWATDETRRAAALAGVDLVVPNPDKQRLLARVEAAFPELAATAEGAPARAADAVDPASLAVPYVPLAFGNTRALVKVEDGCNVGCSFCIIPSTRGRQHSRPLTEVVAEVAAMAVGGVREVVVTGVQISHYRDGGARLPDLVEALLERTAVPRLRLTSIAPWRFDPRLLALFADPRLCRHLHLSLQSGCDATLRRMRRPYTSAAYLALAESLREAVPGVAITTDVIAGFPGESEAEHAASLAFVERAGFARIHAFPYSPRPGTAAAAMAGQVPHATRRRRMAELLALAETAAERFRRGQLGGEVEVLWESGGGGRWWGTSGNYLRVTARSGERLANRLSRVRLRRLRGDAVEGEIVGAARTAGADRTSRTSLPARRPARDAAAGAMLAGG